MLEITGLEKRYGDKGVLRGVDLTVLPGQVLGLLGANGAGKTTLVSIAAGLRSADGGTVKVAGIDVARHPGQAQTHMGIAPQELGIYPTLTVAANISLFAQLAGLKGQAAQARVEEVAHLLGLHDRLGTKAEVLSGGQKRRLHTGMAIVHRPDVLFLDEPTVGADVQSRTGILEVVRELAASGSAIVYTTHYLTELEQLGADIAVLHEGRIVAGGTIDELVQRYATSSVLLRFEGEAPAAPSPAWQSEGQTLVSTLAAANPGPAIAQVLAELGPDANRLNGIDLQRASLESAYVAITGGFPQKEALDVVAA
ncbi:ABC transporter ATP-binding protein [Streptosporangium lutulentum]|uniref:ABC-2 type transport system ATP-binding protein n=1 Tax=Streptosporangium lutulentum TaxID=1461250 RepID=A0ABT9Q4W1_9ACTN|nr:ABC transporter ATP-binding protein [Streptosporangium lutulentum]MDP9841723.1 ABC-2 type transport system ATP-binding protein [Streptosporangium lutulentum]